jgi:predicted phage baseplate assembly protein
MPLPEPILDDLRFQRDLVDEARRRIIRYCPEWTEYNLSDPGITLIELFAWMTEMIVYRLNRVPEKNYIKFMELLGIQLQPAHSARTEITFRLAIPFPVTPEDETTAYVPQGTEVATRPSEEEPEIVFTTDERLVIVPPKLTQLRREEDFNKNYLARLGVEVFYTFNRSRPQAGDTFYLGFDESNNLRGHLLKLEFEAQETEATGIRRNDPPLVWECSIGDGQWEEVAPSDLPGERDTTGGLNNAAGSLVLYLPLRFRAAEVQGRQAMWIRGRLEQRRPEQGMYRQSPRVTNVTAYSLGAATPATHAVVVHEEVLGTSKGEPGQIFRLQNAPVLMPREGETVEIEEKRDGEVVFVPWTLVTEFANSDRFDRHYTLDTATGEIDFGPAVRQPDGSVRQYGRVPEATRMVRFTQYRHGGGVVGNVPAGKLQVMRSAISYVVQASNLIRAEGGRDQETLEEAKLRARREVRAQQRAVTAEDYVVLAKGASRAVARVKCLTPDQFGNGHASTLAPGMLDLLVVPAVYEAMRVQDLSKLELDAALAEQVSKHLDQFRLLTTTVRVREPQYLGIQVTAEIVASEYHSPEAVRQRVEDALEGFVTPLPLKRPEEKEKQAESGHDAADDLMGPDWDGWPFGRSLFISELFSLIQRVPGVKHVLDVQLAQRKVVPRQERRQAVEVAAEAAAPDVPAVIPALKPIDGRRLDIPADTLLVSLAHVIKLVEL